MNQPQDTIFIKGDSLELQFQLFKDKCNNEYWNLLNHEIRFQLNTPTKIYKATANVSGGSDLQISFVDAVKGIFMVHITHSESSGIVTGDYSYEIQITTPAPNSQKYTVLQSSLRIVDESITWETKP